MQLQQEKYDTEDIDGQIFNRDHFLNIFALYIIKIIADIFLSFSLLSVLTFLSV